MTTVYPISITYDGEGVPTGFKEVKYTIPDTDGSIGQSLVTNGSGALSFASATGGAATNEIFLSLAGGWDPTTSPSGGFTQVETATNKVNIRGVICAASANDIYHEWSHVLPADYDGGTITAIPYIYAPAGSTGASNTTIILGLQAVAFADGDTADTAHGTSQTSTETVASSIEGLIVKMTATSAITIGNTPSAGDWVQWRMRREGDDTYAYTVIVLGWMITYTRA